MQAINEFHTKADPKADAYESILEKTSWDATVDSMLSILKKQAI